MRYHELALQRWLNSWAIVREGYPVPVVYSSPLDAFGHFQNLWARDRNPFTYLLDLKDEDGKPYYEPHPSPARYPIISVHRRGWQYRTSQNFSIHRWRHLNWPTVSDAGPVVPGKEQIGTGLTQRDLGEVTTARRPMAWDYRFQIDHFCNRPDTQAFYIEQFMQQMWRTGGVPQTWITVPYPGYGDMLVRLFLEGGIENMTPEEVPDGKYTEFRTTLSVVVEGYDVDIRYKVYPAMWYVILGQRTSVTQDELQVVFTQDARENAENPTLDSRTPPPEVTPPAVWRSEQEAQPVTLDVTDSWSTAGVLLPVSQDAHAVWDSMQNGPVSLDVQAFWDVDSSLGPWTASLFDVDTRNANGRGTWAPNFGSAGQLWVSHDSYQSTGYFGGAQVAYRALPNNDLTVDTGGSSTTPFENYLMCLWHPVTQRVFCRRKNFITAYTQVGGETDLSLGSYAPSVVPFITTDLSWGLAGNATHVFCARGQSTSPSTICKIDPTSLTIVAETAAVNQLAMVRGGIIYCEDTDLVYACGSQTGGKIAAIDPVTCSILGYLDDSALVNPLYLRLAYCASTQRLFVTTSNQTQIHVFNLTGGAGFGEWEASISTGSSQMLPIIYDAGSDRIVVAEDNGGVGNGRLVVINPITFTFERDITHPEIRAAWDLIIPPNGVCYLFQNYPGKIVRFART